MKKRGFLLIFLAILVILCTGCKSTQAGSTIYGFTQRMNNINDSYNLTDNGYIFDEHEKSFSKYIKISDEEILLKFLTDNKNRTDTLHIVLTHKAIQNNSQIKTFINDCVYAFYESDEETEQLLSTIDFEKSISEVSPITNCAETENIKMEIDTTYLGTVISLYIIFN